MIRDRIRQLMFPPVRVDAEVPVSHAPSRADAWSPIKRLDAFVNALTGMGDAELDKGAAWTPTTSPRLTFEQCKQIWTGTYYGRRVIDLVSADAVVRWHKVIDPAAPLAVEDQRWAQEAARLGMRGALKLADQYASAYGTGYIIPITHDSGDLTRPLDPMALTTVQQLLVLTPKECQAQRYFTAQSPFGRVGDVSEYRLSISGNRQLTGRWGDVLSGAKGIHASRVIPIIGNAVSESDKANLSYGEGESVLQALWMAIARVDAVDAAGAILVQELKQDVIKVPDLASVGTANTRDAFRLRMQLLKLSKGLLNMIVLADGEEFESRGSPISGFDEIAENARNAMVAATGIPEPILFGKATSGLATAPGTEQDAYIRLVQDRQEQRIHPAARRIYELIAAARSGPFAHPYKVFSIEANPLTKESDADREKRRVTMAQRDTLHVGMVSKLDPTLGHSLALHILKHRYGRDGWQDEIPEWVPPASSGPAAPAPAAPPGAPPPPGSGAPEEKLVEGMPGADLQINNTGKGQFE